MLFVEFRFFWFFLAVFAVYWSLRENDSRKIWLLDLQLHFLRGLELEIPFPAHGVERARLRRRHDAGADENPRARRGWLILSLCANLGTLAFFKYFNFFISSAAGLLAWLGLPASVHTLNIIIPVGVSFLHVSFDELHDRRVSRKDARRFKSPRCRLLHRILSANGGRSDRPRVRVSAAAPIAAEIFRCRCPRRARSCF